MLRFIKNTEIENQKEKLYIFYILNLLDLLFTQFLLFSCPEVFNEINPFLKPLISDYRGLFAKIFIPAMLMLYWNYRYKNATDNQRTRANYVICFIILAFSLINLLHLFNMSLFITLQ